MSKHYLLSIQYVGKKKNKSKKPYIFDRSKYSEILAIAQRTQNLDGEQLNVLQEKGSIKNGTWMISIEEEELDDNEFLNKLKELGLDD